MTSLCRKLTPPWILSIVFSLVFSQFSLGCEQDFCGEPHRATTLLANNIFACTMRHAACSRSLPDMHKQQISEHSSLLIIIANHLGCYQYSTAKHQFHHRSYQKSLSLQTWNNNNCLNQLGTSGIRSINPTTQLKNILDCCFCKSIICRKGTD